MSEENVEVEVVETEAEVVEEVQEKPEPETKEEEVEATPEEGSDEPEMTPEERIKKLEADVAGRQKAIDRTTKRYYETNERLQEIQRNYEALMSEKQDTNPMQEPSIDDFETHDEWVEAKAEYKAKQIVEKEMADMQAKNQQLMQEQVLQERLAVRHAQEAEYITENPLYQNSVQEVENYIQTLGNAPTETVSAILDQVYAGNVPKMIDYFGGNNGENLDVLGKIAAMPPHKASVEIYKLQQNVNSPVKKETKPNKPKPVKVAKGDKSTNSKSVSQMTGKELIARFAS